MGQKRGKNALIQKCSCTIRGAQGGRRSRSPSTTQALSRGTPRHTLRPTRAHTHRWQCPILRGRALRHMCGALSKSRQTPVDMVSCSRAPHPRPNVPHTPGLFSGCTPLCCNCTSHAPKSHKSTLLHMRPPDAKQTSKNVLEIRIRVGVVHGTYTPSFCSDVSSGCNGPKRGPNGRFVQ